MDFLNKMILFFKKMSLKGLFLILIYFFLSIILSLILYVVFVVRSVPSIDQLKSYHPPLVSEVLDRKGEKIAEFFLERRILVPYKDFPQNLIHAFVAAEDGRFFEHKGIHYQAIFRAFLANLREGKKVQGGSTITQQVARSLLLSSEKTYTRKLKEAILALRMEKHLKKEDILYLYLNQIYLGVGTYGVGQASRRYFRKKVSELNLAECALLAGLPKAPSHFSPIYNPQKARKRQLYVLQRMLQESYISKDTFEKTLKSSLKIYLKDQNSFQFPFYIETLRQLLVKHIGEKPLLTKGLTIQSAMDKKYQSLAQIALKQGLKNLDKRQGFRGALNHLKQKKDQKLFFEKQEQALKNKKKIFFNFPLLTHNQAPSDNILKDNILKNHPPNLNKDHKIADEDNKLWTFRKDDILKGLVLDIDDSFKQVLVRLPFNSVGIIPLKNMKWARTPNPKIAPNFSGVLNPSQVLKKMDVIQVIVKEIKFLSKTPFVTKQIPLELSLDQEPLVEGALIAFDQKTEDIVALVGGYDFKKSQFNRAYQAARQTGSVFKPIVYLSALDKGFSPVDFITDAPVVYKDEEARELKKNNSDRSLKNPLKTHSSLPKDELKKPRQKWRPFNYSKRFSGDILFRNALIRSMNVPTVKIMENLSIKWVTAYAKRLGMFRPLNPDYTLALGSSSATLYEMTKVFSIIGRGGKQITPFLLKDVTFQSESYLQNLSLDDRFLDLQSLKQEMETQRINYLESLADNTQNPSPQTQKPKSSKPPKSPKLFFNDPQQLISPKTAFIMTNLLSAVLHEPGGTGFRAHKLGIPSAGKTGTTNGYYDAWFIGYTPSLIVGVWVGFDHEQSLGIGETGSRAALPIWLEFMKSIYQKDPELKATLKEDFIVPEGIVFINIDNETGKLVSSKSKQVVNQAFIEGHTPSDNTEDAQMQNTSDFLREDLSEVY